MKRLTSDNVFEMNMTELALNQVFVQDGWAWYRKGPEDECSVCDLIRGAAAKGLDLENIELDPNLTDEELGGVMLDWLQFGEEEPEGVLAILYRALWAMAELRERLKLYEDTGLMPMDITPEKPACMFYSNRRCNLNGDWCAEGPGCPWEIDSKTAMRLLAPPNNPLTLEELREMDRDWIWAERIGAYSWSIKKYINGYGFVLEKEGYVRVIDAKFPMSDYGKNWLAYRRRPEEAPT